MWGYMVGTFKLGWKCDGWLLVRDNVRNIWEYIRNVIDLGLVVTCMENVPGPSHMCLKCA